eukprot:Rmarinus@m.2687
MVKICAELKTAIVAQAHLEFQAMQTYLQASFWFACRNFSGIASYLRAESDNERQHALKLLDYLIKREAEEVTIDTIAAPRMDKKWETALDVFETLMAVETGNTTYLNALHKLAKSKEDPQSVIFLDWFVNEQVNEEDELRSVLEKVKAYMALPGLLYHLDTELKTKAASATSAEPIAA